VKTAFTVALAMTFVWSAVSAQNYHPLQTDSATWTVVEYGYGTTLETGTWHFGVSGDTVINGLAYHKIYENTGSLGSINPDTAFNMATASYACAFREDSTKKVWVIGGYNATDTFEYVHYDFSLNVGDTFCFHYEPCGVLCHPVTLVDSVLVNGSYRRQIHFSYGTQEEVWIEGIGAVHDGWIGEWCFVGNIEWVLNCYSEHGVHVYGTCDYPMGTGMNSLYDGGPGIGLFPNPVAEMLTIDNAVPGAIVSIENVMGEAMLTEQLVSTRATLDVASLARGVYILRYRINGNERAYKFVKQSNN
jgi:hypothetical protein